MAIKTGNFSMILTLLYFILTIALLVTVHEYGHFIVARCFGIKVLRFSLGFGKALFRWRDKKDTEYVISALPLGGYVKMLDESEGEVAPEDRERAFNNQPILVRMLVILAGPLFNFLFAFLTLWLVLVIGMQSLAPVIANVKPNSIAAKAGLDSQEEIISIDNQPITSWRDVQFALMPLLGSNKTISVEVQSLKTGQKKQLALPLASWALEGDKPELIDSLGIEPLIPILPAVVGEVVTDTPAKKAGMKSGDIIKSVNGVVVKNWMFLVNFVKERPNQAVSLLIHRDGKPIHISFVTGELTGNDGKPAGFLGVRSEKINWPKKWLRFKRQGPVQALGEAFHQTLDLGSATFSTIGNLIKGKLSFKHLSGPVGIAQGAGESGRSGLVYYLSFLALISVSLGVLNLLPIPMLDGGHLLYDVIELVCRRSLSNRAKSTGVYIGLVLLAGLMTLAITNDLMRLWNSS